MKPIKMNPVFKQYIWGGNNLKEIYGKNTPEPPVAESWEISAHKDGLSVACNDVYENKTIIELCKKYGKDLYGDSMQEGEEFPLLLKILDAEDRLSVQVHPDDEYANIHENGSKGKTEAWYILDAQPGAKLIYGFKDDITKEEFRKVIEDGNLEDVLNYAECNKGDVFYIPSGTVHAVGKGLMIAEIQQSSNTTYRVYDYNRKDKDGNLRELHIEKAIEVSNLKSSAGKEKTIPVKTAVGKTTINRFVNNEFFTFDEIVIEDEYKDNTDNRLQLVIVIDGTLSINGVSFEKGESGLIPASVGEFEISGKGVVLKFFI